MALVKPFGYADTGPLNLGATLTVYPRPPVKDHRNRQARKARVRNRRRVMVTVPANYRGNNEQHERQDSEHGKPPPTLALPGNEAYMTVTETERVYLGAFRSKAEREDFVRYNGLARIAAEEGVLIDQTPGYDRGRQGWPLYLEKPAGWVPREDSPLRKLYSRGT